MTKVKKILGIFLVVIFGAGFLGTLNTKQYGFAVLFVLIVALGVFLIASSQKEKNNLSEENADVVNVKTNKTILTPIGKFVVDDAEKAFNIPVGFKFRRYNFSDLNNFEVIENGSSIVNGKGLATFAGGLTFGFLGAVAGASGKRKEKKFCNSLKVVIRVNDLQNSSITIPYIKKKTKIDSLTYKSKIREVEEFVATLAYIENSTPQNFSSIGE